MINYSETSQFNEAVSKLNRMNFMLYDCYLASRDDDYDNWLKALNGIYRELLAWVTDEELQNCDKLRKNLSMFVSSYKKRVSINIYDMTEHMIKYETILRKVMKRIDLDLPKGKDPRRAIENLG